MGFLKDFGSRNHPERRAMQKARAGMAVSEETVAAYTAARGFLMAEWFGASLMVASFTLLYLLTFGSRAAVGTTLGFTALGPYEGVILYIFQGSPFSLWQGWRFRFDSTAILRR